MEAKLLPLNGKYYGTEVEIEYKGHIFTIKLWNCSDYIPSQRELGDGCTVEQYKKNEYVMGWNGWTGKEELMPAHEFFEVCDSHFESNTTFELANEIIDLINGNANAKTT